MSGLKQESPSFRAERFKIEILRIEQTSIHTLGILLVENYAFCCTLERPWLDNKPNLSCIPAGKYLCKEHQSPKFGKTFEVMNVPCRTDILFHAGNFAENSLGCILLGASFTTTYSNLESRRMISSSRKTFNIFIESMKNKKIKEFDLIIRDYLEEEYQDEGEERKKWG
jgi:hypothetical protein